MRNGAGTLVSPINKHAETNQTQILRWISDNMNTNPDQLYRILNSKIKKLRYGKEHEPSGCSIRRISYSIIRENGVDCDDLFRHRYRLGREREEGDEVKWIQTKLDSLSPLRFASPLLPRSPRTSLKTSNSENVSAIFWYFSFSFWLILVGDFC